MDPYYAKLAPLIGYLVIEHGNLEGDAGKMLARLNGKGDDLSAAMYTARDKFHRKSEKTRKLVEQQVTDPALRAEFDSVLDEMQRVNKERNKYIHSEYLAEVDASDKITGAFYREIGDMGDVIDPNDPNSEIAIHRVNEGDIRKLIKDMMALGPRIRAVSEAYFDSLPYIPPPPPTS